MWFSNWGTCVDAQGWGIGVATTDRILLRAFRRPVYPVDRASFRIWARHGWIEPDADYEDARGALESVLPDDPGGLDRLSRRLLALGKDFCRSARPHGERCPLRPLLPEGGAIADPRA